MKELETKEFIEIKKILDDRLARLPEGIDIEYEIIELEAMKWNPEEEDFICDHLL